MTTKATIERYVAAQHAQNRGALEAELTKDAVLITPAGYVRGQHHVSSVLMSAREHARQAGVGAVEEFVRFEDERVGYALTRAEPEIQLGMNVLRIEGGKIAAHTSTSCPRPSVLERTLRRFGPARQDPDDELSANTRSVIDEHLRTFGDIEKFLRNKAPDVVFITQAGVLRGRDQVGRAFTSDVSLAPEGYGQAVETIYRTHVGSVGYLVYRAEPFVSLGMDTWIVEGDTIAVWAYAAHPMLPNLPDWLNATA